MFSQNAGELWVTLQAKKGNITDTLNEVQQKWQQTAIFAEKYNEMLTSPAGQAALRQITQAQSAVQWQRLVAEQGKFGAALTVSRDRLQQMGQALGAMMGASPVSFGAAVGWMERMAAAASPAVWSTFQGSWHLLAAVIGREFTPYLIEASRWIQRLAFWIKDEMDPATRSNIASWFAWGVALLGVGTIVGHFIGILARLITALGAVRGALGLGAVGGGTLLAAAAVTAGWGFAFADAVRSQGEIRQRNESIAQRLANIPAAAGNAIFQLPQLLGTRNPSVQQGQALMSNLSAIPGVGFGANLTLGLLNRLAGESGIRAQGAGNDLAEWFAGPQDQDIARREQRGRDTIATAAAQRKATAVGAAFAGMGMMGGPLGIAGASAIGRQTPERPLLTDLGFQSQFFGIEDAWRRMQTTAASMSPLRQEIFQIENEQLMALIKAINEPAWVRGGVGGAG